MSVSGLESNRFCFFVLTDVQNMLDLLYSPVVRPVLANIYRIRISSASSAPSFSLCDLFVFRNRSRGGAEGAEHAEGFGGVVVDAVHWGMPTAFLITRARLGSVLFAVVVAAACSGGDAPKVDAAASTPAVAVMPRPATPSDSACPRDGTWKRCALEDRVVKSGLAFKPAGDSMRVAYLSVPGVRYKIGLTASMVAFFYRDTLAAAKDVTTLDRFRLTPRGDTIGAWKSVPSDVIWSGNLVAVLFDASATQIERIRLTITAGAPQPLSEAAKAAKAAADTPVVQTLPPLPAR